MQFDAFCRLHGLIVDSLDAGRWVRVPTEDHPRSKNGAYKWLGEVGFVQNHATMVDVAVWRPEADAPQVNMERINAQVAAHDARLRAGWARAARNAQALLGTAVQAEHNYLQLKGFGQTPGLVLPDGALMVPMRRLADNFLVGAQVIRWLPDEMTYEKKMLPGMRAKGAVFRLGSAMAARTWLVEGFATGLSVEAAIRLLKLRDSVLICFSAGNLIHVASLLKGDAMVFADNDESAAGEQAAIATGLRYCMAGKGQDANDLHQSEGLFRVASLMMDATQLREPVS